MSSSCSHSETINDQGTDICTTCGLVCSSLHPVVATEVPTPIAIAHDPDARLRVNTRVAKYKVRTLLGTLFYQPLTVLVTNGIDCDTIIKSIGPFGDDEDLLHHLYIYLTETLGRTPSIRESHYISPITLLFACYGHLTIVKDFMEHVRHYQDRAEAFGLALWRHRQRIMKDADPMGFLSRAHYSDWDLLLFLFFNHQQPKNSPKEAWPWHFWRRLPESRMNYANRIVTVAMQIM